MTFLEQDRPELFRLGLSPPRYSLNVQVRYTQRFPKSNRHSDAPDSCRIEIKSSYTRSGLAANISLLPGWTSESLEEALCSGEEWTSLDIRGSEDFRADAPFVFPSCFHKRDASSPLTRLSASGIAFGGDLSGDLHDPLARLPSGLEFLDLVNVAFVDHVKRTHTRDATYEPNWTAFMASQRSLTHLRIANSGLAGSLPSTIPDSVDLLDISNNNLTGTIPPTFLLGLSVPSFSANIGWNALTGTIFPTLFLTNAPALRSIEFAGDHNQFEGKLPDLLLALRDPGAIKRLTLSLSYNAFTGSVPDTYAPYCNFQGLADLTLILSHNSFTGALDFSGLHAPAYLSLAHYDLRLDNNKLTGTLPTALFGSYNTDWLYTINLSLASNRITGTLPTFFLANLPNSFDGAQIDLSSNLLVGSIPPTFFENYFELLFAVPRFFTLSLENNNMGGLIPSLNDVVSKATWLNLNFNRNKFDGAVDFTLLLQYASLKTNWNITLSLANNNLAGDVKIPGISAAGRAKLYLSNNRFTKLTCDPSITYMTVFDISNNRGLTGDVPSGLLATTSSIVTYFNASFTGLAGSFPSSSSQPRSLSTLDMSGTEVDFCASSSSWTGLTTCRLSGTNAIGCTSQYSGCNTNPLEIAPFTGYPPLSPYTYSESVDPNAPTDAASSIMASASTLIVFIVITLLI